MIQPAAEMFLEACGVTTPPPLEVVHRDRGVIVRQQMPLPFALIGRDTRADIRLDGREVSRRHAFLQLLAGRWWWMDLSSRKGTEPAGNPASTLPLLDRHGIRIGNYTIRLAPSTTSLAPHAGTGANEENGDISSEDDPTPRINPLATDSDIPALLPRLDLEFYGGSEGMRTWRMDRALALIGRSSLCKVRLHSTRISRAHCALANTPFGLWVVDLLGRDGTLVNGNPVRWGRLEPEDEIQIDQFRIRVRYVSSLPRTQPSSPLLQPPNEEHGLTPRTNTTRARQREEIAEKPLGQAVAPVEFAVPMTGAEALLVPLVKQFSLMQQQMFEQFQHTLLIMGQMFGNLQKEQLTLIRQELEQIQELTRQLHTLPVDKANPASPPPILPPAQPPSSPPAPTPRVKPKPDAAKLDVPLPPPKFQEGDVHAWLSKRIAALQEERQSRWQKVLSILTGK